MNHKFGSLRAFKVNTGTLLVVDESLNIAYAINNVPANDFASVNVVVVGSPSDVSNHEEIELDMITQAVFVNLINAGNTPEAKAIGAMLNQKYEQQLFGIEISQ
jgi:actin-like ATPase involved in cell morphogenesis